MWAKAKSPNRAAPGSNTLLESKDINGSFTKYQMHGGMASPVPNWLFDVKFQWSKWAKETFDIADGDNLNDSFKCIKADLPEYSQATKEVWYFGTKKTFVIGRDMSGETVLEFWLRKSAQLKDDDDNNKLELLDVLVPDRSMNRQDKYQHYEWVRLFDAIEINMLNIDTDVHRTYKLINPIVTNFSHSGELNYEGEEGLKISITVHYDMWEQH